jgi:hypothetical protein
MEPKNIYKKLQEARLTLSKMELKKSGENKFSHYFYFELSDFMPAVILIFNELGMTGVISFTAENAVLIIVNSDKPDDLITFTSPVAGVDLKGMHAIQNLGAIQTYLRRYLYMAAMDITEPDALDAKDNTKPQEKVIDKTNASPNPKEYPPDERSWMTEKQFWTVLVYYIRPSSKTWRRHMEAK